MNLDILHKYIENRCSRDELKQVQAWLQEDAANEDFFRTFLEAQQDEPGVQVGDVQNAWNKFKENHLNNGKRPVVGLYKNDYKPAQTRRKAKRQKWLIVGSAAAVVLLAITAVFWLRGDRYFSSQQTSPKVSYRTIATQKGQQAKLHLKDGTFIMLNAASTLRIPEGYGLTERVVYLYGEAFFRVAHNEKIPFVVKSGQLVIKDLGTAFNISAYDSTTVSIAVKEGAVSIRKVTPDDPVGIQLLGKLNKGNVGYFDDSGSLSISAIHNMALFTGWIEGKLVFKNTPFVEVIKHLERRFDVNANILDETLKKRTLTATYNNLSLEQVLNVLSVSLHISYRRQNDTIIFKPKM